jgi:phosphohistidine phosphatase SixA
MSLTKSVFALPFALALSLVFVGVSGGANAETLSGASLVEHLRHGGYVLLMRHASSPTSLPDKRSADFYNTNLERQLDVKGRSSAIAMGNALKRLGVPIGTVLSSPTYRALETVRLASLGSARTYVELGDGGQSMVASAVTGQAAWLKNEVSKRPAPGSNTIIVTHMPNIVAAFESTANDLSDGETLVFEPRGNGKSELVAKVKIEDWPALAQRTGRRAESGKSPT